VFYLHKFLTVLGNFNDTIFSVMTVATLVVGGRPGRRTSEVRMNNDNVSGVQQIICLVCGGHPGRRTSEVRMNNE